MRKWLMRSGWVVLALLLVAPAWADEFYVANNGLDNGACGLQSSPCRSINYAIGLAEDGDRIIVGPGIYSFRNEPDPGDGSLILVDKAVSIRSTRGAAATVIEACPSLNGNCIEDKTEDTHVPTCAPHPVVVKITASDATFGSHSDFGFTLLNGTESGLVIDCETSGVTVKGNYTVGSYGDGYSIDGSEHVIERNTALSHHNDGFKVRGDHHRLARNRSELNWDEGFVDHGEHNNYASNWALRNGGNGFKADSFGSVFTQNAATANFQSGFLILGESQGQSYIKNTASSNNRHGFELSGSGAAPSPGRQTVGIRGGPPYLLDNNAVVGNRLAGILTNSLTVRIERNNIFGNDANGSNCGVQNTGGASIPAERNFWGVSTGPAAAQPADNICGSADTTPFATTEYSILVDVEE